MEMGRHCKPGLLILESVVKHLPAHHGPEVSVRQNYRKLKCSPRDFPRGPVVKTRFDP